MEYYIRLKALVFFKKTCFVDSQEHREDFKKLWGKEFKMLNLEKFYFLTPQ